MVIAISAADQRGGYLLPLRRQRKVASLCSLARRFERALEQLILVNRVERLANGFAAHALTAKLHADAPRAHALSGAGSRPMRRKVRVVEIAGLLHPRHHAVDCLLRIRTLVKRIAELLLGSRADGEQGYGLFQCKGIGALAQKRLKYRLVKGRSAAVGAFLEQRAGHDARFAA